MSGSITVAEEAEVMARMSELEQESALLATEVKGRSRSVSPKSRSGSPAKGAGLTQVRRDAPQRQCGRATRDHIRMPDSPTIGPTAILDLNHASGDAGDASEQYDHEVARDAANRGNEHRDETRVQELEAEVAGLLGVPPWPLAQPWGAAIGAALIRGSRAPQPVASLHTPMP